MTSLSIFADTISRRPIISLSRLLTRLALQRSRRNLGCLDDHLLRDIGLDRTEARREADQPIWNAPHHWLR
ncbi:DUF1127 domain-containing protein [Rubellimicrobium roseum]|uniref:DUF1127 domain-containing protein n=1 Tax=Rubellimicrobium roseum TaxID=687525 RepID=A0A5C4NKX2_9RHOB|nr:DUF1127 domain-containing protein [Rubellimicrobium roseum]TNC73059.1 DUF1127 domain-containing protein [Rubellimicrobium roseum]